MKKKNEDNTVIDEGYIFNEDMFFDINMIDKNKSRENIEKAKSKIKELEKEGKYRALKPSSDKMGLLNAVKYAMKSISKDVVTVDDIDTITSSSKLNKQIYDEISKIEAKGLSDIELLALVTNTSYEVVFYAKYHGKMYQSNNLAEDGILTLDFVDEIYATVAKIIRNDNKYDSNKMNIVKASGKKVTIEYYNKNCRIYKVKKNWKDEISLKSLKNPKYKIANVNGLTIIMIYDEKEKFVYHYWGVVNKTSNRIVLHKIKLYSL